MATERGLQVKTFVKEHQALIGVLMFPIGFALNLVAWTVPIPIFQMNTLCLLSGLGLMAGSGLILLFRIIAEFQKK